MRVVIHPLDVRTSSGGSEDVRRIVRFPKQWHLLAVWFYIHLKPFFLPKPFTHPTSYRVSAKTKGLLPKPPDVRTNMTALEGVFIKKTESVLKTESVCGFTAL